MPDSVMYHEGNWHLASFRCNAMNCWLWVTCGRRHGKSFFDVFAALVGCGHVSGLLMRQVWPLDESVRY